MVKKEQRPRDPYLGDGVWGSVLSASNTFELIFNVALIMYMYVCIGRGIEDGVQKTNVLELSDNSLININWFTPLDYRFVLHIQQTILTIITFKCLYNGTCFGRKFWDWQQLKRLTRVLILFFILIIHFYIRIHKLIMHKSTLIKQTLKIEEEKK